MYVKYWGYKNDVPLRKLLIQQYITAQAFVLMPNRKMIELMAQRN